MSQYPATSTPIPDGGGESLKSFQLTLQGIKDKSSREYGLAISKYIWNTTSFASGGYYVQRNARFIKNRNYANGQLNIQAMFQDRFQFNGKQNYMALAWNALQIVNRIVSGLVGRWMDRNEKIQVKAIDDLSQTQKQDEYDQIAFVMENREMLAKLQQESGVQLIPDDKYIPADREELNLWQIQFQRLPEEILYELGCNDVLTSNGVFDVIKEKLLHDVAETGFLGTYTWMDNEGIIHVRRVKPENSIYGWSEYDDFRDSSWLGEAPTLKISEIRKQYGKEFNPDNPFALTEQEIWERVVPYSKEYQYQSNLAWNDIYINAFLRPYDEWNVRSIQFELRSPDSEPYTVTKSTISDSVYTQKGFPVNKRGQPKPPSPNQNIIQDSNINIYRGVYLPDCDILLQWGLKDNMIRPQDPKEIGNAEFSYSFYMVQNYDMMCMAVPEKIQEPADQMILARLKIQQLVMKMRPVGTAINWRAVQNIDYGLGENNKSIDFAKYFDQTGSFFYHDKDAEGNPIGVPFTEVPNAGFLQQLQGLILLYDKHYQILKDELGEDPNLITQAAQPRVAVQNIEASQQQAAFATDYFYLAYKNVMIDTSRKVACLLKNSVTYGAEAYRNIIGKDDVKDRIFTTKVNLLPDTFEIQRFEAFMNQMIGANPELMSFLDPFQLTRVAKEDVKLAELLFRNAQKKLILYQQQTAAQNQQQTIQGQIEAAKTAEEEKRKTKEMEVEGDIRKGQQTALAQNQTAVLNLVATLLKPTGEGNVAGTIPPELRPLVSAVIDNVMIGSVASSEEQKMQIQQQVQQARAEQEQMMMEQQQQMQNQPQEMAA